MNEELPESDRSDTNEAPKTRTGSPRSKTATAKKAGDVGPPLSPSKLALQKARSLVMGSQNDLLRDLNQRDLHDDERSDSYTRRRTRALLLVSALRVCAEYVSKYDGPFDVCSQVMGQRSSEAQRRGAARRIAEQLDKYASGIDSGYITDLNYKRIHRDLHDLVDTGIPLEPILILDIAGAYFLTRG